MSLFHEFHDQFVICLKSSMTQLKRNPSITVATFVLGTNLMYRFSFFGMLFRFIQLLQMIIKAAPGEFGCYQEFFQRELLP